MKIAVVGIGYVGLSIAILLAQKNEVIAVDVEKEKVDLINNRKSPIKDKEISEYLREKSLNLEATTDADRAYKDADFVVIATPTNYDTEKNYFDVSSVESVIQAVWKTNPDAVIVIKSTIPVGYTKLVSRKFEGCQIMFSPEFLREGHALYDNLFPSRIIVGRDPDNLSLCQKAEEFAELLRAGAVSRDIPGLLIDSTEAEAIKLFANTYLAVRVAFFNELDTYAEEMGLCSRNIIDGICMDTRIHSDYNNPSFGYGGYCLPKDTRQLLANYKGIPQNLISAVVQANDTRKTYIAERIQKLAEKRSSGAEAVVGIYRITMKTGSDNFRQSAIQDIMTHLKNNGVHLLIYEPLLKDTEFMGYPVEMELNEFKEKADLIVANRYEDKLCDVADKLYTRDIFRCD